MALAHVDHARDAAFSDAIHGTSASTSGGVTAMCNKNPVAHKAAVDDYFMHWDNTAGRGESQDARQARKAAYAEVTGRYYDIVTDAFEHFFGKSFHFYRILPGKPLSIASRSHEQYLATKLGLQKGQKVLDVGSGVGGPAREIARFTGANVIGLNYNNYQIQRANRYTAAEGLQDQVNFVQGDFMKMEFEPASFDAAYSIEGTSYAPNLKGVYTEIFKVLKPGGTFAVYELIMTDAYNNEDAEHRKLRFDLEQGMGVTNLVKISDAIEALKAAGFEVEEAEDLACRPNEIPWYYPWTGSLTYINSIWDIYYLSHLALLQTRLVEAIVELGERAGIFAPGYRRIREQLVSTSGPLIKGGKEKLFTPIFIMVGKKPL